MADISNRFGKLRVDPGNPDIVIKQLVEGIV